MNRPRPPSLAAASPRRGALYAAALALALCCASGSAWTQARYPTQPVRFIVPYAAAGLPDIVIRRLSARLGERLGQTVVVENKPGAGGAIAVQALMSAPADGHTFIFSDSAFLSITPLMSKNVPYDPKKDFVPVALVARAPNFLAVNSTVAATNLAEFVALARAKPGEVTCGSSGVGTLHHLTLETMKRNLDIDVVHVPFRGSGQSVPAMAGGQTQCTLAALPSLSAFTVSGKARLLAIAGSRRSALAPDVPAMYEGKEGLDFAFLLGAVGRQGVPADIVKRIADELGAVAREPEIVSALQKIGVDAVGAGPADYEAALRNDAQQLGNAVRAAGIKPE
jgi:tripartite-type tricarboxylate transporter receptor subunit TctC